MAPRAASNGNRRADMRLLSLAGLVLFPVQAAWAQAPGPPNIVLREAPVAPETEIVSVQTSCGSRTFKFMITNRVLSPSVLSEAVRDGRPPRDPESTNALRRFLAGVRNVHITGSYCVSDNEIGISLYGLLRSPPPGQRDDATRQFRIRF